MLLVVLEHGRASSPLPIDHHVENGVQAAVTGEHLAQLPLGHGERMRRLAAAVQNARDQVSRRKRRESAEPRPSRSLTSSLIRSPAMTAEKSSQKNAYFDVEIDPEQNERLEGDREQGPTRTCRRVFRRSK